MMKTVLITGAAGFLGSHLCDLFISKNYRVIGVDNLITGDLRNLKHIKNHKRFKFINDDINDNFLINEKIHFILHFASIASPYFYLKFPLKTLKTGSVGTENILKIALKNKARILIASTSEVYGDPLEHPQNEDYFGNVNPIGERSVYDESKRFMESITMAYKRIYNLEVRIARIFNTYGPRMKSNDGRALPKFMTQALSSKDITVYGDGKQTRSFCYVDDLVDGIYKLLFSKYDSPINLGNPEEISVIEFANEIIELVGNKNKIIFKDLPENDPLKRRPDISKAMKILNWKPLTNRKKGLIKTLEHFKKI